MWGAGGGRGGEQSELQVTVCSPEPPYESVLWSLPFGFSVWSGIIASVSMNIAVSKKEIINKIDPGVIKEKRAQKTT